jgi:hypothetical protein
MAGVGWSLCTGGGVCRRRVFWPAHGGIVQLVGSGSFTKWRRDGIREELKNGVVTYLVHAHRWAEEVWRGWFGVSGVVALGLRTWELHPSLVKLTGLLAWTRGGWGELAVVARARAAWRAEELSVQGQSSGGWAWWVCEAEARTCRGYCPLYAWVWGGRAADLTVHGGKRAWGLGERRRAD